MAEPNTNIEMQSEIARRIHVAHNGGFMLRNPRVFDFIRPGRIGTKLTVAGFDTSGKDVRVLTVEDGPMELRSFSDGELRLIRCSIRREETETLLCEFVRERETVILPYDVELEVLSNGVPVMQYGVSLEWDGTQEAVYVKSRSGREIPLWSLCDDEVKEIKSALICEPDSN